MASKEANLIETLYAIATGTGNRPLETRMADMAVWYYNNKTRLPRDNLAARQDFLEKAVWIMLEIIALQQDRIHDLESRGRSKNLWLPSGATLNGQQYNG